MSSHLLSSFILAIQSLSGNNTGSKLLLGAAGIVSMLAMLKTMRQKSKAAKQKMSKAQRKEMRKLKWKMRWMMLKKFFAGDGKARLIIVIIIFIGAIIGLYILVGWWLAALILLLAIFAVKEVDG